MNLFFQPNSSEQLYVDVVQNLNTNDYALIRMTSTMLEKSIIDASQQIRNVLIEAGIVDYDDISQGDKIMSGAVVLSNEGWVEQKCSYYRPETKKGDPRFWVYNLKSYTEINELVMFTVKDGKLVVIPLASITIFNKYGKELFPEEGIDKNVEDLISRIRTLNEKIWIPSMNEGRAADKDVGVTLENALNLPINSLKTADFLGEIELKCKRTKSKTRNNLFAQVPDWKLSALDAASDYLLKYGIESEKHPGYKTLYVTVRANPPNPQGFFFDFDYNNGYLLQNCLVGNDAHHMCTWTFEKLKSRLYEKHPKTLWIEADEEVIDGKTHFRYHAAKLTQRPVFGAFLNLVGSSEITMDWTHRVLPDRTKYNDHGNLFKIPTKSRSKLFSKTEVIKIIE